MKKLNLEEFYQEGNAYYQSATIPGATGLCATILITPTQTVAVYNNKELDTNDNLVDGLEHHESTSLDIIANLFHKSIKGTTEDKIFTIHRHILDGVDLNYVIVRLTNSEEKIAHAEIPVIINPYQAEQLAKIASDLTNLNVHQQALIHPFNPDLGIPHHDLQEERFPTNGIVEALKYQKDNERIKENIHIKNALYPEYEFSDYDQEITNNLSK